MMTDFKKGKRKGLKDAIEIVRKVIFYDEDWGDLTSDVQFGLIVKALEKARA